MPDNYRSPWGTPSESSSEIVRKKLTPRRSSEGLVLLVLIAALIIGGFGLYKFLSGSSTPQANSKISLEFLKPNQILTGEPFAVSISTSNHSDNVLKNAKLSLFLPEGVFFVGQSEAQRVSEMVVGDLGPGNVNQQTFNLLALSGEPTRRLEARLTYSFSQTTSAQYESVAVLDILTNQPAMAMNVGLPQSVFNGQDFEITVSYSNNTAQDFKDVRLAMEYPPVFHFKRASVSPDGGNTNSWKLGDVPAGAAGTIAITGNVVGPEGSFFDVAASLSAPVSGKTYVIQKQAANVAISESPLSLSVQVNDRTDYVAQLGESLLYSIRYRNNSDMAMQNVKIQAKIIGELFDFSKVRSEGNFNSLTNTITWFPATTAQLSSVASKEEGIITFGIPLKMVFPIRLLSDKNYTLKINAQIESPTVPQNITAEKTVSVAELETKVAGKLEFVSAAYWRDAASGILNEGPYPPRVNQATQFTVHWRLINHATDVQNVRISAYLQSGARLTGKTKSTVSTQPSYNPNSGLVTWEIPFIPATKGFTSPPAEAIFQVEIIPASNQINSDVPLLGETSVEWTDAFVGQTMRTKVNGIDTSIPADTSISGDRKVQP